MEVSQENSQSEKEGCINGCEGGDIRNKSNSG